MLLSLNRGLNLSGLLVRFLGFNLTGNVKRKLVIERIRDEREESSETQILVSFSFACF